jgi:tetratricopeptide (TPR) repeat protein
VKAAQLHLRSGGSARAAALLAKAGDFAGAADIFRNKGDSLRAAQALELSGDKATAAREFREAGHYERAARLLKEEGLFSEAADTYRLLLKDRNLDASTVEQYYSYAALLALAGETGTAAALYSTILQTCGNYRKAKGNLRALGYGPEVLPSRGDSLSPPPPAGPSRTGAVPVQDHPEPPGQVSVPLSPDTASLREEFNDSIVEEGSGTGREVPRDDDPQEHYHLRKTRIPIQYAALDSGHEGPRRQAPGKSLLRLSYSGFPLC